MKTLLRPILALLLFASVAPAQSTPGWGAVLGGGYFEQPEKAYGFLQIRYTPYEDAAFAHTIFGELVMHGDDVDVDYFDPRGGFLFSEDGNIVFVDLTLNYELEAKIAGPVSVFAGAGAGGEFISVSDDFHEDSIDDDLNFIGQAFAGIRAEFQNGFFASLAVRRIFREDFELLDDQFITEDTWGFEIQIGTRF